MLAERESNIGCRGFFDGEYCQNQCLSDIADFSAMNEVYSSMIPEPYPARTTVGAQLRGIKVEIEVIALQGARYEK
jgi:enamine deaminase RidA (YjgF/YER057c/UK114 family)